MKLLVIVVIVLFIVAMLSNIKYKKEIIKKDENGEVIYSEIKEFEI